MAHSNVYARDKIRIGTTLHPYYSYAANIAGDVAEVVPLIGAGFNPHAYEPQPDDIKKVASLDVLIVNGVGHDEFAFEIVAAARRSETLPLIFANEEVALIPVGGSSTEEKIVNSHTFISITTSIQQVNTIVKRLSELFPDHAAAFRKNGRAYTRKLRQLKARYMDRIAGLSAFDFRCATIHGAYDYLLQEFGLEVTTVIEPRHGVKPTASQLRNTIDKITGSGADVVFSELNFPSDYIDVIREATGITVYSFSHISEGGFTADLFEKEMGKNLDALTSALLDADRRRQVE